MSRFENLKSADVPGAREIRVVTLTEEEIFQRAREGFIFAHPGAPVWIRRMARAGKLDWMLASARQAMRDIEKPVDFLTHEARAAWVLNMHAGAMQTMTPEQRAAVAQITVTAVRVGTKDNASAPHAVIHIGPALLAIVGLVLAVAAIAMSV